LNTESRRALQHLSGRTKTALFIALGIWNFVIAAYLVRATVQSAIAADQLLRQSRDVGITFLLAAVIGIFPMPWAFFIIKHVGKLTSGLACHEEVTIWLWLSLTVLLYAYSALLHSLVQNLVIATGVVTRMHI
jgi:hypothetical protein